PRLRGDEPDVRDLHSSCFGDRRDTADLAYPRYPGTCPDVDTEFGRHRCGRAADLGDQGLHRSKMVRHRRRLAAAAWPGDFRLFAIEIVLFACMSEPVRHRIRRCQANRLPARKDADRLTWLR